VVGETFGGKFPDLLFFLALSLMSAPAPRSLRVALPAVHKAPRYWYKMGKTLVLKR